MNTIDIFPGGNAGLRRPCDIWVNHFAEQRLRAFRPLKRIGHSCRNSPARWHGTAPNGLPILNVYVNGVGYFVPFLINHSSPTTIVPAAFLQDIGVRNLSRIGKIPVVGIDGRTSLLDLIELPIRLSRGPKNICLTEVALMPGTGLGIGMLGRDVLCRHLIGVNNNGAFCSEAAVLSNRP